MLFIPACNIDLMYLIIHWSIIYWHCLLRALDSQAKGFRCWRRLMMSGVTRILPSVALLCILLSLCILCYSLSLSLEVRASHNGSLPHLRPPQLLLCGRNVYEGFSSPGGAAVQRGNGSPARRGRHPRRVSSSGVTTLESITLT